MKFNAIAAAAVAFVVVASCSGDKKGYTLNVEVDNPEAEGTMVLLTDFDNDSVMDSVTVVNGKAVFTGQLQEPTIVRLIVNGNRAGMFILEDGETVYKDGRAISSLNDRYQAFLDDYKNRYDSLFSLIDSTMTESEQIATYNLGKLHLDSVVNKAIIDNIYNPIGYMLFLQQSMDMESSKFTEMVSQYPHLSKYHRIQKVQKNHEAKAATAPGMQYSDFAVEYNDSIYTLSSYVEPGKYTLVDFWASWCGPCKREIEIVKDLYAKYHNQGLNVVGVTVWEDPEQTQEYLAANPLPWPVILNAQAVPTEMYGINGIPCIMLIDPEGNIVARDLFDDELVTTVATAIETQS